MNILQVSFDFPPRSLWGMGVYVGRLSQHLADRGHSVVVLTRHQPVSRIPGVSVIYASRSTERLRLGPYKELPPWLWAGSTAGMRTYNETLARECVSRLAAMSWTPDVIQNHNWTTALAASLLAKHFNVPLVSTIHILVDQYHAVGFPMYGWQFEEQALTSEMFNDSNSIITLSNATKAMIERQYEVDVPIHTVRTGFDIGKPASSSSPLPTMLYAGRMAPEKGVLFIAAVIDDVVASIANAQFIFAGDGPLLNHLRTRFADYPNVHLLGHVSETQLEQLYCSSSLVALPSLFENFPLVAGEAMSFGLPVVAFDTDGINELVKDGETGKLVPLIDDGQQKAVKPALLIDAIVEILGDPAYAQRLGRNSRTLIESLYSVDQWINTTLEVLQASRSGY